MAHLHLAVRNGRCESGSGESFGQRTSVDRKCAASGCSLLRRQESLCRRGEFACGAGYETVPCQWFVAGTLVTCQLGLSSALDHDVTADRLQESLLGSVQDSSAESRASS